MATDATFGAMMSSGSGRTGVGSTVQTMTLENPTLIKDVQESSLFFDMPFEDLIADALKLYKESRSLDDFFKRMEKVEEVSDEENAEIEAELESMTDEDRMIVRTETITI